MYKIKQQPEDFIVKEINALPFEEKGVYAYYLLRKREYTTQKAVETIANAWNIRQKDINVAGMKDRNAITEQYVSIFHGPKKDFENNSKDIMLRFLGYGNTRLCLGELQGNRFEIVIRNLGEKGNGQETKDNIQESNAHEEPKPITTMKNYFDEQRFGMHKNNHLVGKFMLQKKWKEACDMVGLQAESNNYVAALRALPKRIVKMYVHAYQSHLFNMLIEHCSEGNCPEELPLIGFGTPETAEVKSILQKEGIVLRDFIVREIPELSSEGGMRKVFAEVKELEISELEEDELNPGRKKCRVSFVLGKGCYATAAIKQMMA